MKPIDNFNPKSIDSFCLKPIDWPLTHSIDQNLIKMYKPLKTKGKFKMHFFRIKGIPPFRRIVRSFVKKSVLKLKVACLILTSFCGLGGSSIERTSALGTGLGASAGVFSSAQLDPHSTAKSCSKNALLGGLLGMASSYLVHKWVLKKEDQVRRQSLFNLGVS